MPPRTRTQTGFMLIELMIVIAIIAIIAAIAIPNLLEARKGANESAAISTLRTLTTAQALFHQRDLDGDGAEDFAHDLSELFENGGLIDEVLATGRKQGYRFSMISDSRGFHWAAEARPALVCRTGERFFFVDETGVIRFRRCERADESAPELDGPGPVDPCDCTSAEQLAELSLRSLRAMDRLMPGALQGAEQIVDPATVSLLLGQMDGDADGQLSFGEVLQTDPLAIARDILRPPPNANVAEPARPEPSLPTELPDAKLEGKLNRFFFQLAEYLKLGIANEADLPSVPLAGLEGDAAALLEEAAGPP